MGEAISLIRYEAAKAALAEAVKVDEVQAVRDFAQQMRAYAKIAKDRHLQADAAILIQRAERKLGVLIQNAKETGQLGLGRRSRSNVAGLEVADRDDSDTVEKVVHDDHSSGRVVLEEIGVSKDLSSRAQKWARMGDDDFERTLSDLRDKIVSGGAKVANPDQANKKAKRAQREIELAARQQALPDKRYGVIYADPEWRFEPYSRDSGMDRSADNHYPTSGLDEIMARPVQNIAADDSVLFLWATVPMLPHALAVMSSWGFNYKSHTIWRKAASHKAGLVLGTGYWFRNAHELLLVGTRGKVPAPAMGDQWPSMLDAEPMRHSQKPAIFHELIEAYFPNLPKIELNAREARPGWDLWGYEAPAEAQATVAADDLTGEPLAGEAVLLAASPAPMTKEAQDDVIARAYASTPFPGIAWIMAQTGLTREAVKSRAKRRGLGDKARTYEGRSKRQVA